MAWANRARGNQASAVAAAAGNLVSSDLPSLGGAGGSGEQTQQKPKKTAPKAGGAWAKKSPPVPSSASTTTSGSANRADTFDCCGGDSNQPPPPTAKKQRPTRDVEGAVQPSSSLVGPSSTYGSGPLSMPVLTGPNRAPRIFDTHCHAGLIRREREKVPVGGIKPFGPLPSDLVYDTTIKGQAAFSNNVQRLMMVGIDDKTSEQAAYVCTMLQKESARFSASASSGSTTTAQASGWLQPWSGYSCGIHPHYAHEFDQQWDKIVALARGGVPLTDLFHQGGGSSSGGTATALMPVAIGETGLDYFKSAGTPEQQKHSLKAHVDLAKELDLLIILHVRDAYDDLFRHFEEWDIKKMKGVLHCFSSNLKHMQMGLDLGLKISFCGTLTYPKSDDLKACMKACPPTGFVFETDAPFLPPQSHRGKINAPAFITETVQCAAKLRNEDPAVVADMAWQNSCELFQIPMS